MVSHCRPFSAHFVILDPPFLAIYPCAGDGSGKTLYFQAGGLSDDYHLCKLLCLYPGSSGTTEWLGAALFTLFIAEPSKCLLLLYSGGFQLSYYCFSAGGDFKVIACLPGKKNGKS